MLLNSGAHHIDGASLFILLCAQTMRLSNATIH